MGRPETDQIIRAMAMGVLGNSLYNAGHNEEALSVQDAELSAMRRAGAPEGQMLAVQGNIANTYVMLGRHEDALLLKRDVYSGHVKLEGAEHINTLRAANNYAVSLIQLQRQKEAKALLRKTLPVARRVLGENDETTLRMRWYYAEALYKADGAARDNLREAVITLEDVERTARRVFGGAHPLTSAIEEDLRKARAGLAATEQS